MLKEIFSINREIIVNTDINGFIQELLRDVFSVKTTVRLTQYFAIPIFIPMRIYMVRIQNIRISVSPAI